MSDEPNLESQLAENAQIMATLRAQADKLQRLAQIVRIGFMDLPAVPSPSATSPVGSGVDPPSHPFNAIDADVIIKSSDGVEYRLFQRILSQGSPFFESMFTLPQTAPDGSGSPSSPQVVDVPESSEIMEPLLQLLYPTPNPSIESLDMVSLLINAAIKYDFAGPLHLLRQILVSPSFLSADAFKVYSIAVKYQLTAEMSIAAAHTFNLCLLDMPISDDHKQLSAYEFFKLIKLHQRRSREAQDVIRNARPLFRCPGCSRRGQGINNHLPSSWWLDFEARACEELQRRPSTKIIFSPSFVAKSARASKDETGSTCGSCALDILTSQTVLDALRTKIESLSIAL